MATVGQNINGYIILRELTSGSFCISYEVQKGGVRYFMKEYMSPTRKMAEYASFFNNQNIIIPRLNSLGGNVEKIVDSFETKYRYFQVKEFIEGENLKEWMFKYSSFSLRRTLAMQMCEVIDEIHCKGIVHQDLKPEQFMVVANGKSECGFSLILTDFDWSIPDGKVAKKVGTPYYSNIDKHVSQKTDIFALGIMLSELLVGRKPHNIDSSITLRGEDELNVYWRTLVESSDYTAPIFVSAQDITIEASNIIVKCLDPKPSGRPGIKYIIEALKAEKYSFKPIISTILVPIPSLDASVSVSIIAPSPSLSKRIESIDVFERVVGGVKDADVLLVKKPEFVPLDNSIEIQSPFSKLLQKISSIGDIFRK